MPKFTLRRERTHLPHSARLRRSVGLVIGHADCGRPARARVSARRSAPGSRCRSAMCRTRFAASAAGIPAAVTTGTAWVAVRNLDLAAPITGIPNSACACPPRPGRPAGSRRPSAGPALSSNHPGPCAAAGSRARRTRPAGRAVRLEIFATPRPEKPTTPASNGNPADVIHRQDLTYDADPLSARPVPGSAGLRPSGCVPSAWRSCRTARPACARTAACPPGGWRGRRPPRRH